MSRTKVFGIGFPRTGTMSLVRALNLLGIRSLHNPVPLLTALDHPLLQSFDGFADNPLPLIYPQLDARFPGSRFILTDRDVEGWLGSVRWMLSAGRTHGNWDARPAIVAMHTALYGAAVFDADRFRDRFLRHRRDVHAYFAGRRHDLLIMDLARGDGWDPLCRFLERPVPRRPFPHDNRRRQWYVMARLKRKLRGVMQAWRKHV